MSGQVDAMEIPSKEAQREIIKAEINAKPKDGETWYVISQKWFEIWKKFVNFDEKENEEIGGHPGQIENEPLLQNPDSNGPHRLSRAVQEGSHFVLVNEKCGKLLHSCYGGLEIQRKVISDGNMDVIELYPHCLKLALFKKDNEVLKFKEVLCSKKLTIEQLLDVAKEQFGVGEKEGRLWAAHCGSPYRLYSPGEKTQELQNLITRPNGQQVILEIKIDGKYPISFKHSESEFRSSYSSGTSLTSRETSYEIGDGRGGTPGVVGLSNLGNTCFMNSALQCFTKVPQIQDYFLTKEWQKEINVDNPLGMGGKVAEVFGELLKEVWSGKHSVIAPRDFKNTIGQFQPSFSGYSQQDAQEFLSYLMDGIHEDLNRIVKKPSTINPEVGERDFATVAEESWNLHKKRNDSIIVDKFQGQIKSTLVCPKCENVATVFQPIMYLTLPLPVENCRIITVTLFQHDTTIPTTKYAFKVPKSGGIAELRKEISKVTKIKATDVVIADVFHHRVYKFFADSHSISNISESDTICAYELPNLAEDAHAASNDLHYIPVKFCSAEKNERSQSKMSARGTPFALPYDSKKTTTKDLYDAGLEFVKRYLKDDISEHFDLTKPETLFPQKPVEGEEDEVQQKKYLFSLRHDSSSYNDDNEEILYSDDLYQGSKSMYSSTSDKKLLMYIDIDVLEAVVDAEKFQRVVDHESLKTTKLSTKEITIEDCIELYTSAEILGPDDPWYCGKCKNFVQAEKKLELWKLPDVLVVHLKRFSFNKYSRDKLDTMVNFPIEDLDLNKFVLTKGEYNYDLIGITDHYGSLGGGHYTAVAKVGQDWYKFDDSSTYKIKKDQVINSSAYLLFFVNNKHDTTTEFKGLIYPTKEQLEEEERMKKEAEERKKKLEEEKKKQKEQEAQ